MELLSKWNRAINLIAPVNARDAMARHYVDSLALVQGIGDAKTMLDVGAGAGFPGTVIALARPDLQIHLVESVSKKAHFIMQLRRDLPLPNITVFDMRLEQMDPALTYDLVTGRAVAAPSEFAQMLKNRVNPGGRIALFHAGETIETPQGMTLDHTISYQLPLMRAIALFLCFSSIN